MNQVDVKDRKQKLLALIGSGAEFRNAGSPPLHVEESQSSQPTVMTKPLPVETPLRAREPDAATEPPPERPEILKRSTSGAGGMQLRERRRGMRSDPAWQQKTIYLKRVNINQAEEIAHLMGIDLSVLVDYALSLQVQASTRTPELQKWLDQRRNGDGF